MILIRVSKMMLCNLKCDLFMRNIFLKIFIIFCLKKKLFWDMGWLIFDGDYLLFFLLVLIKVGLMGIY